MRRSDLGRGCTWALGLLLSTASTASCEHAPASAAPKPAAAAATLSAPDAAAHVVSETTRGPAVELVESWPAETTLDHADVPDARDVWPKMIDGAARSVDIGQFYISNAPDHALEPVLSAIERAGRRGVQVRVLVEEAFYAKYPESVDRLAKVPNVRVERFDVARFMGGILHAKYFVVDGHEAYVGSQNFDWRSLEHIQEMGVRVRSPEVAGAFEDIFATDFDLAGGAPRETRHNEHAHAWPVDLPDGASGVLHVTPVATPKGWLPDESMWTLAHLLALIDGAKREVHVQVLTYAAAYRDGSAFTELDAALRRAAKRGVAVQLLVSDWSKKGHPKESLDALATVPGVEVRVITVPAASTGPIPFARVAHAKYMVVDGEHAWVGSSNWEGDYFYKTRNVGVVVDGARFAARLDAIFKGGFGGGYATPWSAK